MVGHPVTQCDHVHDLGHEFNQYIIVLMLKKKYHSNFFKVNPCFYWISRLLFGPVKLNESFYSNLHTI